jgi:signal peptidase II
MRILLVSAVVVVIDQVTKTLTRTNLDLYDSIPVIPNFFHLTYVTNDGMAFGLNFPGGIYLFSAVSIILTGVIFFTCGKNNIIIF